MQGRAEVAAETAQRHRIQALDLLQHLQVTVRLLHIQIMGHAAKLQVQVQQQGSATPGAELLGQVAGQQGRAGPAFGAHYRDQFALALVAIPNLHHQAVQGRDQFSLDQRLRQHITGAGLHRQAHSILLTQ
ncbi:hypothetical protein D3C80_1559220 [compost metagenome]